MTETTKRDLHEVKRDLCADLAICNAATAGPWRKLTKYEQAIVNADTFSDIVTVSGDDMAYVDIEPEDATFIVEARTAWPHAIERAISAERWLLALVEALERGDIAQTRLSSGTDYVVYCAKKAAGR